jgi:hypothetical protein
VKAGTRTTSCPGVGAVGERLRLLRLADDPDPVAEPLDHRARDEDGAFEREGGLAVELVGDGGEEPVLRHDRRVPGVEEREAAGAVGGFQHPGREAGLPHGGGLLVARDAEDRDFPPEEVGPRHAEVGGAVLHLGQHGEGDVEEAADLLVPAAFAQVVEERAGGVRGVRHVARPPVMRQMR